MKKIISGLLVFAMIAVLFGGCGNTKPTENTAAPTAKQTEAPGEASAETKQEEASPYKLANGNFPKDERGLATQHYTYEMPLSTTDEVFTMWTTNYTPQYIPEEGYASMSLPTYDRNLTGVNIEYIILNLSVRKENFSVLRASDDLCDVMCWASQYYGGAESAILDEGYFANIYDYRDYAPNYFYLTVHADPNDRDTYDKTFLSETEVASMWVLYANPVINGCYVVRGDWMKKLGKKAEDIVTWDDLYDTMKMMQVEHPSCQYPFGLNSTIDKMNAWVFTSFDTIPYVDSSKLGPYFIKEGKVCFSNFGDNDRRFLDELHRFMDAGLVQPNWTANFGTLEYVNEINNGGVFYVFMTCNDTQAYVPTNEDPDVEWTPIGSPLRTKDQIMDVGPDVTRVLVSNSFNFSAKCANLPLIISWCDWLYTPEGGELWSYGLEGEVWEYDADGNRVATELITNNPDGLSYTWAASLYAVYMGALSLLFYNHRNFMDPATGAKSWDVAMFIIDWNKAHYKGGSTYPAGARLTPEETEEVSEVSGDIMTYIQENYMLFATQNRDMAEWDAYVQGVYDIGMQNVMDIYQTAYDRYLAA